MSFYGASAHRDLNGRSVAIHLVLRQSDWEIDADSLMLALILVDSNIAHAGLKQAKRMSTELAAKGIDVKQTGQSLVDRRSSDAFNKLARTAGTVRVCVGGITR